MERRTFLQRTGLALLTLAGGWVHGGKSWAEPSLDRYLQALGQSDAGKLALLVGVDRYPFGQRLNGCGTDVELQRELLIHRFGFNPKDTIALVDREATREAIETAFVEHLVKQAKEGDVVVFHFSGYGSLVKLPTPKGEDHKVNSLVPVDGLGSEGTEPVVNDILEETLVLLARSLATRKVTLVLDTSYKTTGKTLQGNWRSRSCPEPSEGIVAAEELDLQQQLRQKGKDPLSQVSQELLGLGEEPQTAKIPGIILTAAGAEQTALEGQWNGFSAGLFTYSLTQYLWQATPSSTVQVSLARTAQQVQPLADQDPQAASSRSEASSSLVYYLRPWSVGADGVVTEIEENGIGGQIKVGGLPPKVWESYGVNSRFLALKANGETVPLQLRSRDGLTARVKKVGNSGGDSNRLQVGQLVQESIRILPRHLGLAVALDAELPRIERVDATSVLATIPEVAVVGVAGEQGADCLLGKVGVRESNPLMLSESVEKGSAYALFSAGRQPIPNTNGTVGEAVKSAVNRLNPTFKTMLARKLWLLTVNEGSSALKVKGTLSLMGTERRNMMRRSTIRTLGPQGEQEEPSLSDSLVKIPSGSQIQYQFENFGDRSVYLMLMGLDSRGKAIGLYTPSLVGTDQQLQELKIEPGMGLMVPQAATPRDWLMAGNPGWVEMYAIASVAPFRQTQGAIARLPEAKGDGDRLLELPAPLEVARLLLEDLHQASAVAGEAINSSTDVYALDVGAWATFSFSYQVV